jgi:hypothetical protein
VNKIITRNFKRILITALLFLGFNSLNGQTLLGKTVEEVKKEFQDKKYELESGYDDDNEFYITANTEQSVNTYYFKEDLKCYLIQLIPMDQGKLNSYVQDYNDICVIISDTKWKLYSDKGIINIELIFAKDADSSSYFIISN